MDTDCLADDDICLLCQVSIYAYMRARSARARARGEAKTACNGARHNRAPIWRDAASPEDDAEKEKNRRRAYPLWFSRLTMNKY